MESYYALIMAGGGGTRLWPMSRKNKPKQLLALFDERSLFKISVDRLLPLFPPERILIVTGHEYVDILRAETPEIPPENFITEPAPRDTAPAAALGISIIHRRDPNATIALLTADHHIADEAGFLETLRAAYEVAQGDCIVTLGITPAYPATGFGYIRQGEVPRQVRGYDCYPAVEFTEKPHLEKAQGFLAAGDYTWNSGMFVWTTRLAMREFERQQPQFYGLLQTLGPAIDTPDYPNTLETVWKRMPKISVDFAIMEGAERMVVLPVEIGWNDVGSWESLFDVLALDENGNCFRGLKADEHIGLDTTNTLVFSDRLTVTIGLEDAIVIDTQDVLMICRRDRSQDVKSIVNHLQNMDKSDYL
jgi:mannose-1-phosphate guanylyltransferase